MSRPLQVRFKRPKTAGSRPVVEAAPDDLG